MLNFLTHLPSIFISSVSQGFLWSFLAIGVYITFRLLDIPDMTTEGSFPLGGAIVSILILQGVSPIISTSLALLGGMLAGLITGLLHTKLKIPALLAGIITMTGLYSINSRIMANSATLSLIQQPTVFSWLEKIMKQPHLSIIVLGGILLLILLPLLYLFFQTEIGLAIIATGDNLTMSQANGINTNSTQLLGYMLANGLIALSGALLTQQKGFSDLNAGIGTIVIGLASIIVAEVLFKQKPLLIRLFTIVLGTVVYRLILAFILELPIQANDNKFFSALFLAGCLCLPLLQQQEKKLKKGVTSHG